MPGCLLTSTKAVELLIVPAGLEVKRIVFMVMITKSVARVLFSSVTSPFDRRVLVGFARKCDLSVTCCDLDTVISQKGLPVSNAAPTGLSRLLRST